MAAYSETLVRDTAPNFNVIEEFSGLSVKQKMTLWEHNNAHSPAAFGSAVKLIWPQAEKCDVIKLQRFMVLLQNSMRVAS